jgi:hypothetical protein
VNINNLENVYSIFVCIALAVPGFIVLPKIVPKCWLKIFDSQLTLSERLEAVIVMIIGVGYGLVVLAMAYQIMVG